MTVIGKRFIPPERPPKEKWVWIVVPRQPCEAMDETGDQYLVVQVREDRKLESVKEGLYEAVALVKGADASLRRGRAWFIALSPLAVHLLEWTRDLLQGTRRRGEKTFSRGLASLDKSGNASLLLEGIQEYLSGLDNVWPRRSRRI